MYVRILHFVDLIPDHLPLDHTLHNIASHYTALDCIVQNCNALTYAIISTSPHSRKFFQIGHIKFEKIKHTHIDID